MKDITSEFEYVKQRIPDPQIKDVADQFFDAAQLCWVQPPGSGVIVPAIINSVLSIELYLKSLKAYSVIEKMEHFGNGTRGGVVTVKTEKSGKTGHELSQIYDAIEGRIKDELEDKYRGSDFFLPSVNFRDRISPYDQAFIKVRYLYEDSSYFKKVNIVELKAMLKFVRDTVETLPKRFRVINNP